jgi:hypothetical protein
MTPAQVLAFGLLAALALRPPAPAADVVVTDRMHHLRLGDPREWSDFPAAAEGPALVVPFDASSTPGERTLRVHHRDVKAAWRVRINGAEIGRLPADEADTISYWPVGPGTVTSGRNELRIDSVAPTSDGTAAPDDILIGDIRLIDRPRRDVLAEATIDISVRESPAGVAIPSRITVTDEHGALVSLGNVSDGDQAVRPGVVYSRTGNARLMLPAGRYVIYAGRGFEYGVDRVPVDVARGQPAARRLTIRREVDTPGWAAMDTHVHTATFARHGDASIEERMLTVAGEGIELPVSSEHNTRVDFEARAVKAGVRAHFTPILGTEVTTPALGHFNVFPVPDGGAAIDHRAADWTQLAESIATVAPPPVVVLNHGRDVHGGFRPLGPTRHLGVAGEDLDGWTLPATAMEIVNSGAVMSDALALTRDWMGLLNRGIRLAPVGSSDSHDVARYIVGQGRTYVPCPDRRPDAIDRACVVDAVQRGRVMVAYGLLAEIDVEGRGPGDLVRPGRELAVRLRVLGPGWTRAQRIALYANGTLVREETIPRGEAAGVKFDRTWRLPTPAHDVHLVAVATGPGVTAPYWPTAKPYQPTSPDFTPYVLGVSGALLVDADGSGAFDSVLTYARRALAETRDPRELAARLGRYDDAVATQAASLLRARDGAAFESTIRALIDAAPAHVARGLQAYLDAWRASGR